MTDDELTAWVKEISRRDFHREFEHKAVFNKRLKTTGGRFHLNDQHLDFNPTLFKSVSEEELVGVIRHELVHYHLYRAHRGYKHRDADFKRLLQAVGGSRFAPSINARKWRLHYACTNCGQDYYRVRRIDLRRFRCGRCKGRLVLIESAAERLN